MYEQRIIELVTRKLAGEATSVELGELSYLLTKYPDAIYYEALLEQVWELGSNEEPEDLYVAFEKHKLRFKEELNFDVKKTALEVLLRKPVFLFTALICVLLSLSIYYFNYHNDTSEGVRVEITAGKGVRKEIKLPDGTQVRLNSESKLSYQMDMQSHKQRNVVLTGEAFFKVAHDKERPFLLKTNNLAIKVLGTEFNVKDYPDDAKTETTLMEGSIELTINGRSDQKFLLKPSEKLALVENKNKSAAKDNRSVLMIENISPVKVGNTEYIEEISWTENKFVFQNESFEELLPKLERWYNVRIVLEDPKIRSYRFTGIFINEDITQALEAMQLIKSFHYKLEENEVKIY